MAKSFVALSIGHTFKNPSVLEQALTHRSHGGMHNERLEFLGDSVLNCAVAAVLVERFPAATEGDLTRIRSSLVNRDTCARVARTLGVSDEVKLGAGEMRSGGRHRESILADVMEAIIGAVFLDAGFHVAKAVIERTFAAEFAKVGEGAGKDAKTRLQELLQSRRIALPEYAIANTSGDAHSQVFDVECRIGKRVFTGAGRNRRAAEQEAAAEALRYMARMGYMV